MYNILLHGKNVFLRKKRKIHMQHGNGLEDLMLGASLMQDRKGKTEIRHYISKDSFTCHFVFSVLPFIWTTGVKLNRL